MVDHIQLEDFYDYCTNKEATESFLKQLQKWIDKYNGKETDNTHGIRNHSR